MNERADPIARDLDALRTAIGDWLDALAQLTEDEAMAEVERLRADMGRVTDDLVRALGQ